MTSRDRHKPYFPDCLKCFRETLKIVNAIKVCNKLQNDFKELPLNKFRKNLTQWLKERFYKLKQYMSNREDRMLVLTLTISVDIVLRRRQLYTCELEIGLVLIVAIPVISNNYRETMG